MNTYARYSLPRLSALIIAFLSVMSGMTNSSVALAADHRYRNPLSLQSVNGKSAESCTDPSVIHGSSPGDDAWYLYCTTDPLRGDDRDADGNLIFHLIPTYGSTYLVNWAYQGDVFATRPS